MIRAAVLIMLVARLGMAQVTIAGRVLDENGNPLSGVRVTAEEISSDISRCCGPAFSTRTTMDGLFRIDVPPSMYVIETAPNPSFNPDRKRVDARASSVSDVVLRPITGAFAYLPDVVPRAALISIGPADAAGMATIAGRPGAVPPESFVVFSTLETGHLSTTQAAGDGSFSASHFAPAGSFVMIEADPYGHLARRGLHELAFNGEGSLSALPGTIVQAPEPNASGQEIPFASCGLYQDQQPPVWFLEGTIDRRQFAPGETLGIKAKLRIESRSLAGAGRMAVRVFPGLDLIANADGSSVLPQGHFASTIMSPTAIPLEHGWHPGTPTGLGGGTEITLTATAADRAEASFDLSMRIPSNVSPGYYRPSLWIPFEGSGVPVEEPPRPLMVSDRIDGKRPNLAYLPVIRVGSPAPPRLIWTLLSEELSNGSRGTVAMEDRDRFGLASRIVVNSDRFIVPRFDARSKKPIHYRLEPFAPTISLGDRAVSPAPPRIPFRFPSGSLRVTIRKPDGSTETIGPAPFVQSRQWSPVDRNGYGLEPGSGTLTDLYQLSTMDPRFVVSFANDGLHRITFDGTITDIWGNEWAGRGTYEVFVAQLLSLDTATIPGTPFEVGDTLSPSLVLAPSVPADVEVRVQWFPGSDRAARRERVITGRANRFGFFAASSRVQFDHPGEYRVDVVARWDDGAGNLWMGARTWSGVIAPKNSTIEVHGKRGIEAQPDPRSAWFVTPKAFGHVFFPFHSGDVHWAQQFHATLSMLTFDDRSGTIPALLKRRGGAPPNIDELAALGELPIFSSRADGYPLHYDPAAIDLWGYQYTAVERPLVRVREQNNVGEVGSLYWRFRSRYARQFGIGANGDLPNDFKFQFGGAVIRGSAVGAPRYGIYGSLFVLAPDDDPLGGSRIFPPFTREGGPLFSLKGRTIDLFFHPTAVRPGSIFERNETASFAGYSAPTLPSKVEIALTSPSGLTRTIRGQANKVGWFFDPGLRLEEEGVWKAKVKVTFDGATSAGQLSPPYPTGDVLGSREGEFNVYVVRGDTSPLEVRLSGAPAPSPAPEFVRPADGPITFTITPPPGLTNTQLTYTTTMPGFILEEGTTNALTYTYDAQKLAKDFPNLDLHDQDGFAGADTIAISFLLSGTDASGARNHFARQIVIQGEELQMPEQRPAPVRRRRSVRP